MSAQLFFSLLAVIVPIAAIIGYFLRKTVVGHRIGSLEARASRLISDAKNQQKEILLQARDKAIKIIDAAKHEEENRRNDLVYQQKRLEKRETLFDQKLLELQEKQQKIYDKAKEVDKIKEEIQKIKEEQADKLEKVAKLSQKEAKELLLVEVEKNAQEDLLSRLKKLENETAEELEKKTKEILGTAIQRCSISHATEITTSTVDLPSDEMKGRIIGREGRNIKTLEQLTGVEIVVDDTPQAITISGFNPIRRQVAKKALEKLILDGRIHPGRIEEAVEQAKKELAIDIKKAGEEAAYQVGVAGLDPKLVQTLGRLKYRTSYGQSVLQHSIEVAHLSTLLAEELGADTNVAKKGGLLHDIGKALDHEIQGGHPEIGYDLMKKFGLPEEIAYIAIAHHEDAPKTLEGIIAKVADAISGARPGARKDTYENYLQRLGDLEKVATSFAGIEKAYAIQAGREIRVFVTPTEIDDLTAHKLAREIAVKIENELKYPGEIKVNLIREMRVVEYAR
ncbi:MAG: ribonuclease Y [bacterium]